MKSKLFILALLLCRISFGQVQPYLFSAQIDSLLKADSTPWKFQTAAWNYSYIGNYKKALEIKDKQFPNAKASEPTPDQTSYFKQFKPQDAREVILKEAAKTRIVIINEAHHVPLHRIYLASLLGELRQQGYTFLAMEALGYEDSLLNQRKYPLLKSGFYVREPCFGNLIREACLMGFTLFPYEQVHTDSLQKSMGREKAEAMNIKKILDQNPGARIVVYCGYDHAAEDTLKNFMGLPMAGQLKCLTGIDPFTIDQTALTEYYLVGSRYRKLMQENTASVFIDSNSHYFNNATLPKKMDCNVYHPNTDYTYNRPGWLLRKNTRWVFVQDKISIAYPCLVKIYLATEDTAVAVPIDVVEITSPTEKVASLAYKHKRQVAVILNPKGEMQVIQIR